jgi:hypothetical protein
MFASLKIEINRIRKSREASPIQDVTYKTLSDAAVTRAEFWLKRIATFVYLKKPVLPVGYTEVPPRMKSLLKKYICPDEEHARDVYFLFQAMIIFLLRNYSPKNPRSTMITVDAVDQSVVDQNGPLFPYLEELLKIRSLPYLDNGKACDRRK